ncbi:hypothetical protein ACEPAI_753 [Sanghuangporus weigelae]
MASASALNTLLTQSLFRAGDYADAEKLHLKALATKEKSFGERSIEAALTRNALGEAQLKLGKLDEAKRNFVQIRNEASFRGMDAAYSRENLAQVLEGKGNLIEAKEVRRSSGAPDALVCTNFSRTSQSQESSSVYHWQECLLLLGDLSEERLNNAP